MRAPGVFQTLWGHPRRGLCLGYVSGYIRRVPQVADADVIRYVRAQQLRKLSWRKSLWDVRPL